MPAQSTSMQPSKYLDLKEKTSQDMESGAYHSSKVFTVLQVVAIFLILGIVYQAMPTDNTCIQPDESTCNCVPDNGLLRWILLGIVVVILIDLRASVNIGEKFWGGIPIFTNIAATLFVLLTVFALYVIYAANANKPGYIANNFASHPEACGDPVIFGDPINKCAKINKNLLPADPPVDYTTLPYSPVYDALWYLLIVFAVIHVGKVISMLIQRASYSLLRSAGSAYNTVSKAVTSGSLKDIGKVKDDEQGALTSFYLCYDSWLQKWHIRVVIIELFFSFIFTCIWFGYFHQESRQYIWTYTDVYGPIPTTVIAKGVKNAVNFTFYFVLTYNIVPAIFGGWFMNLRYNTYAFILNAIGVVVNGLLGIMWLFVYYPRANMDGQGDNIANSFEFCKAYTAIPFYQFYTNAANKCPNTFACETGVLANKLTLNTTFQALGWYILTQFLIQLFMCYWYYQAYRQIETHRMSESQKAIKEFAIINRRIDKANQKYDLDDEDDSQNNSGRDYPLEPSTGSDGDMNGAYQQMIIDSVSNSY